jgi:hypothetical protein
MEILNLDDYLVDLSTKDAIDAHTYNKESDDEGNIGVLSLGPGSRFSPTRKEMLMQIGCWRLRCCCQVVSPVPIATFY